MHRILKKLLPDAKGESIFSLAIFLDVRGFSEFSVDVDSAAVGVYVKKLYLKILDNYFPKPTFFKPTGDGLMIITDLDESDEEGCKKVINENVQSCFKLLSNFSTLFRNDAVIYFETPQTLGIGMKRCSLCCLKAGDTILDYSGKDLNFAARYLDLARPSGIVTDSTIINILSEDLKKEFVTEKVYTKGIAEEKSITISYSRKSVKIPSQNKYPIISPWVTIKDVKTLKQLDFKRYRFWLPSEPKDKRKIQAEALYPLVDKDGKIVEGSFTITELRCEYEYNVGKPCVFVYLQKLKEDAVARRVGDTMPIRFTISYMKH